MRRDFSLMKEMNVYTHVAPQQRVEQLNGFIGEIQQRDEAKKELNKWQIQLDEQLVQLQGRTIESEAIIYKDVRSSRSITIVAVRLPFSKRFVTNLRKPIGLAKVDLSRISRRNISIDGC